MSRTTATIALVGYVLGGWLLPALHHHAAHSEPHGCQHDHGAVSVAAAEAADASSSCCYEHAHSHHHSEPTSLAAQTESRPSVSAQSEQASCDAMCLLCQISARKISPLDRPLAGLSAVGCGQLALAATEQPVASVRLAVDCPRGPPVRMN